MDKEIELRTGQKIHYFKQPESKPIILVVTKRKKAGLNVVFCKELGSNSKRFYTLDKLELRPKNTKEIMENINDYNTAPEQNEVYNESRIIQYKAGNNILICTLEFKAESDGEIIYPERQTFSISKIEFFRKVSGFSFTIDLSSILIEFIGQDHLLNVLETEIEASFTGGCYELD